MTEVFRGKVVDVSSKTYTVEVTGSESKVSAFLEMIRPLGMVEMARTGKIAVTRGAKTLISKGKSKNTDKGKKPDKE